MATGARDEDDRGVETQTENGKKANRGDLVARTKKTQTEISIPNFERVLQQQ
jgi:hypothetical protein